MHWRTAECTRFAMLRNGGLASLEGRVSQRLYRELETADLLAQSKALSHSWRFGAMKGFTITSMRQMEFTKNEPVLQMAARIESTQSLETRDGQGALVRGSHAQPTPVTEVRRADVAQSYVAFGVLRHCLAVCRTMSSSARATSTTMASGLPSRPSRH